MQRTLTFSYGMGRQTAAMAVLIRQGKLPRPACIVVADTGREATESWEYTDRYIRPMLAEIGLEIEVAGHDLATVDLYGHNGDLLIPAFTETGKLPTLCSTEWKKRVVQRYLRSKGYGPDNPIITWLGISRDESHRLKQNDVEWQRYHWPLALDLRMTVADCVRVILEYGFPEPPQSSCWMCPHRGPRQWARLQEHYPHDWRRAVTIDATVYETHGVRLHRSGVPLADADLSDPEPPQSPLFDVCPTDQCMV